MIILFKYCADFENCESFKSFSLYIYIYIDKTKIKLNIYLNIALTWKVMRDSKVSLIIYIYIYIDEVNSALSIIDNLTNSMYLIADKFSDPKKLTMIVKNWYCTNHNLLYYFIITWNKFWNLYMFMALLSFKTTWSSSLQKVK